MKEFTSHTGVVATMDRANVDTDQIIPKQFLKRIERTGFGQFLFFDWRFEDDGSPNRDFELNQPGLASASILVARRNFGSGSSREHAVWALDDYGFRAVIAPSFADIFYGNSFKNGLLPVRLTEDQVEEIFQKAKTAGPGYELTINLDAQTVTDNDGILFNFEIDEARKQKMLNGLDDIALTLQHEDKISEFEAANGL
ncbi:3-isopropylmalate dehydratase small subunit [Blastopirellula retiformator]|uniref:3-isopropylmalate dehydratase small subunit n=1 Tax=Blastopirellula retiformator TaxID=2527970 RepID=A0A5C5UYZ1_9BACT|nr:3-isopropylmalate dehydratase small subunit [Blastopirellula retiformator]TWT31451.1 3-isopropylmalate dehydratase small subunit 1 [Blastopirellula retiformator]